MIPEPGLWDFVEPRLRRHLTRDVLFLADLRAESRWVVARPERDAKGKLTKVPYCAFDIARPASNTNPRDWCDFETAARVVENGDMPWLGYQLDGSGRVGIDLDKCRDPHTGAIAPWAQGLIDQIDSYAELSISGTGLHIIANGALPPGRRRTLKAGKWPPVPVGSEVEVYDSARYFVMTGNPLRQIAIRDQSAQIAALYACIFGQTSSQGPRPIDPVSRTSDDAIVDRMTDDELLTLIRASKQHEKFEKLMSGDTSLHGGDHSVADLALCSILAFWTRRNRDRIDRLFRRSELVRDKWNRADYRDKTIDKACAITEVYEPSRLILDPRDPLNSARAFVTREATLEGVRTLEHQHSIFYQFDPGASAYYAVDEPSIRARLYRFLDQAKTSNGDTVEAFKPTKTKVEGVVDALRAVCNLPTTQTAPCWLANDPGVNPLDVLPCRNGLLHIPTRTPYPPTPNFFSLNGLDFDYDPDAPAPIEWELFLQSIWADDQDSIETLQEMFGYLLVPDTRFQKIFLIPGPKRSGKGTLARVLRRLVGMRNTCSPTLAAFGRDFGKQVLIDKTLAIISDARISGRTDSAVVAEALLAISGEDDQTIPRKFLTDWNGKLPVRFVMLANELPRIADASGALASRFIVLVLRESFLGREDLQLSDRLANELPAILNWALEGRDRLYQRGHFVQPASGKQMVQTLDDLASPEAAFVRERCDVASAAERHLSEVAQPVLFHAWCQWCTANGILHPGTRQTFGRSLRAVLPWLDDVQHRDKDDRLRYWRGLSLKSG